MKNIKTLLMVGAVMLSLISLQTVTAQTFVPRNLQGDYGADVSDLRDNEPLNGVNSIELVHDTIECVFEDITSLSEPKVSYKKIDPLNPANVEVCINYQSKAFRNNRNVDIYIFIKRAVENSLSGKQVNNYELVTIYFGEDGAESTELIRDFGPDGRIDFAWVGNDSVPLHTFTRQNNSNIVLVDNKLVSKEKQELSENFWTNTYLEKLRIIREYYLTHR